MNKRPEPIRIAVAWQRFVATGYWDNCSTRRVVIRGPSPTVREGSINALRSPPCDGRANAPEISTTLLPHNPDTGKDKTGFAQKVELSVRKADE